MIALPSSLHRSDVPSPDQLSLVELVRRSREETQHYVQHTPTTSVCCLELFRRALELNDQRAWTSLYEMYQHLVWSWVLRVKGVVVLSSDDVASLANEAFAKFYRSLTGSSLSKFQNSVPALLQYLKLCVRSVVLDDVRARQYRACEESLEATSFDAVVEDFSQNIADALLAQQIWQTVLGLVRTEQERIFLILAYHQDMKPCEVQQHSPHLFHTIDAVYSTRRNVLERLRRNHQLYTLFTRIIQGEEPNEQQH